jgi:hypothetical protein
MVKQIGITDRASFLEWCESQQHLLENDPYKSGIKRKVVAIGIKLGFDYQAKKAIASDGLKIQRVESFIKKVKGWEDWSLDNGAALLLHYESGGGIKQHRDNTGYGKKAAIVSSTGYYFQHGNNEYYLEGGGIFEFDSKVIHQVKSCSERWSLAWWRIDWKKVK